MNNSRENNFIQLPCNHAAGIVVGKWNLKKQIFHTHRMMITFIIANGNCGIYIDNGSDSLIREVQNKTE